MLIQPLRADITKIKILIVIFYKVRLSMFDLA